MSTYFRKKRERRARRRLLLLLLTGLFAASYAVGSWFSDRRREADQTRALVEKHAAAYNLDPNLVSAVIKAESGGDPRAVSRRGARGLMQLMPATAKDVARRAGIAYRGADDLFDPDMNIRLGSCYLAMLRRQFNRDPRLFLAAYNAGPGRVQRWREEYPRLSSIKLLKEGAVYPETRRYVGRVLDFYSTLNAGTPVNAEGAVAKAGD